MINKNKEFYENVKEVLMDVLNPEDISIIENYQGRNFENADAAIIVSNDVSEKQMSIILFLALAEETSEYDAIEDINKISTDDFGKNSTIYY